MGKIYCKVLPISAIVGAEVTSNIKTGFIVTLKDLTFFFSPQPILIFRFY